MVARQTLLVPLRKAITTTIDVSHLYLERGHFITIATNDGHSVEVICKADGSLQVCVDDETLEAGVHRFEDIYGPDPFKVDSAEDDATKKGA